LSVREQLRRLAVLAPEGRSTARARAGDRGWDAREESLDAADLVGERTLLVEARADADVCIGGSAGGEEIEGKEGGRKGGKERRKRGSVGREEARPGGGAGLPVAMRGCGQAGKCELVLERKRERGRKEETHAAHGVDGLVALLDDLHDLAVLALEPGAVWARTVKLSARWSQGRERMRERGGGASRTDSRAART